MPDQIWTGSACARAGVAGNPSDALGGAALAVPVPELWAEVQIRDADRLTIRSAQVAEGWPTVSSLVDHTARLGHDGGDRLASAALVTLHRHLIDRGEVPQDNPFELRWRTCIPRSVGLAGSSALVIATLRALAGRWAVELSPAEIAELALGAEVDELGIAAGWMDRAVQAHGAPTLVDAREVSASGVPTMQVVVPRSAVEVVVAWDPAGASPSGRLHGSLRSRLDAGDAEVVACVQELVAAAHAAADALERADVAALADAVDASCGLRRRLGALDRGTAALVAAAAAAGGAATSAGSGGAVLVVPRRGAAGDLAAELDRRGIATATVLLDPDQERSTTVTGTTPRTSRLDGPTRTS
jgi:glucuronokinase